MSTIEWPPLGTGGLRLAVSHIGKTLLNRPLMQALIDMETGTPIQAVWMTEAELEAYHQARAGTLWVAAMPLLREQGSVLE